MFFVPFLFLQCFISFKLFRKGNNGIFPLKTFHEHKGKGIKNVQNRSVISAWVEVCFHSSLLLWPMAGLYTCIHFRVKCIFPTTAPVLETKVEKVTASHISCAWSGSDICERMCSLFLVEGSGGVLILPLLSRQFQRAMTSPPHHVHLLHGLTLQYALSQSYLEEAII